MFENKDFKSQDEFNSEFKTHAEVNSFAVKNAYRENSFESNFGDKKDFGTKNDNLGSSLGDLVERNEEVKNDLNVSNKQQVETSLSSKSAKGEQNFDANKKNERKGFDAKKTFGQKKLTLKLSSFLFLCVAVTTTQDVIKLPVLKEVFTPITSVISKDESPPKASTPIISKMVFNFSGVVTKEKKVSFGLSIDNFDLKALGDDCNIYLVPTGDATEEYLKLIPKAIKDKNKISVTSSAVVGAFKKYMDKTGEYEVMPSTKYTLLVCSGEKIVAREDLTTRDAVYFEDYTSTRTSDKNYEYFNVHPILSSTFDDYTNIMVEFENTSTHVLQQRVIPRFYYEDIPDCRVSCERAKTEGVQKYKLRMYVSTDHPDEIVYTGTTHHIESDTTFYLVKDFGEIAF